MTKKRRVIETLKNALIVLLLCSAIWLVQESRLFRFPGLLQPSPPANRTPSSAAPTQQR